MDAKSFYSERKVFAPARSISHPEVSEKSDLSFDSDESDFVLESDLMLKTEEELDVLESDSEAEQPVTSPPTALKPAKKPKNETVQPTKTEEMELQIVCINKSGRSHFQL